MRHLGGFWRRRALPLAMLGCLLATAVPAAADPDDRLDSIRERQARVEQKLGNLDARSSELLGRIEVLDRKRADAEGEVESLEQRLDRLQLRIETVEAELTVAQRRIALLTRELQDILADLQVRTDTFTDRAVSIYKAGPTVYVDSLLTAESMNELFDRYAYYRSASEADSELISEIELLRDETTNKREIVEAEEERIAKAKLRLEEDRAEVAALHHRHEVILAQRREVLNAKQSLLARVESKKAAYEEVQRQLDSDAAQIQSLLAAGAPASGPLPSGGGQLLWPTAGPLTSSYGYRTHPIFGDTRLHTGIDIGAAYGAPVIASGSGTVVYAGAMSGYGNVIAIDHGGGLATTYNHLSSFYVGNGQRVARGARIGAVGCTGYCTGPHLHFEVRVNGNPVDPMPYLR